ncbi:flagellar hook-length control protein FliK [uncultured Algimonas sp.]|uniref:flagellar hook-length control protein FliK n=1 Tax=uncultured Algimonas sp. TaxID=1547920 RepID=UPI0026183D14|nr:flagellar hook-length control protein FliK [uncultured Algimonas sp.]
MSALAQIFAPQSSGRNPNSAARSDNPGAAPANPQNDQSDTRFQDAVAEQERSDIEPLTGDESGGDLAADPSDDATLSFLLAEAPDPDATHLTIEPLPETPLPGLIPVDELALAVPNNTDETAAALVENGGDADLAETHTISSDAPDTALPTTPDLSATAEDVGASRSAASDPAKAVPTTAPVSAEGGPAEARTDIVTAATNVPTGDRSNEAISGSDAAQTGLRAETGPARFTEQADAPQRGRPVSPDIGTDIPHDPTRMTELRISDIKAPQGSLISVGETALLPSSITTVSLVPLTPVSGMSERLAATILQTTQANAAVPMDRIPQAVVAVALSARSATLQIDPPELGRIQLDYQFDTQGRTVVTLTPETDAARAALADRMATITAALEQGSGSKVDVQLGESRDFGAQFEQQAQDGEDGTGNGSGDDHLLREAETPVLAISQPVRLRTGGSDRLHIRV